MKRPPPREGKRGRPSRESHRPLSRQRIVKAALRIVDRDGLAALSMRRLGACLGVDPMAIYYHVSNKGALYDAIVEAVMSEMDIPPEDEKVPPMERLKRTARAYKDALLAHPNALPVLAARPMRTVASLRPVESMTATLVDCGLPIAMAMSVVNNCGHYIMGSVQSYIPHLTNSPIHEHDDSSLQGLPLEEFPNVRKAIEAVGYGHPFERDFELGLDAMLRGYLQTARQMGDESAHSHT